MTKKFWKDWQKRVYETLYIDIDEYETQLKFYSKYNVYEPLSYPSICYPQDRIIKAEFDGDNVKLVIEKHNLVMDYSKSNMHYNTQNYTFILNRNDIKSVMFNKRGI